MFGRWKRRALKAETERGDAILRCNELAAERDEWKEQVQTACERVGSERGRADELYDAGCEAADRARVELDHVRGELQAEMNGHYLTANRLDQARAELSEVTEQRDRAWHAIEEASDAFRKPIEGIRSDRPEPIDTEPSVA